MSFKVKQSNFGKIVNQQGKANGYGSYVASFLLPEMQESTVLMEDLDITTYAEFTDNAKDAFKGIKNLKLDDNESFKCDHEDSDFEKNKTAIFSDPRLASGLAKAFMSAVGKEVNGEGGKRKN